MTVYRISSKDDPRLEVFRDLPRTRDRSGDGRFIAEGRVLVERLWLSGLRIESVFADETHEAVAIAHCDPHTPIYIAPKPILEETIGFSFHRGLLACGVAADLGGLSDYLKEPTRERDLMVVLDRVVDQENMGGIIRNAAGLGAGGILIGPDSARPYSRRVLRVSMGAVFNLPPRNSSDLGKDIQRLKQSGYRIAATVLSPNAIPLDDYRPGPKTAVLFGNEGHGVDPRWRDLIDDGITIPMQREVDSLNVASASAIFLHHMLRT